VKKRELKVVDQWPKPPYLERNQLPNPPMLPSSMATDSTYPMKLLERKKSYI